MRTSGNPYTQVERETAARTRRIRRCRANNVSHKYKSSSKGTHNPRCTHTGTMQIRVADSIEQWVWICHKHFTYFVRELGGVTVRDDEESEPDIFYAAWAQPAK